MGLLLDLRQAEVFRQGIAKQPEEPFKVLSISEAKIVTIESVIRKTRVSEFERPMFELAVADYNKHYTSMLESLLSGKSRPVTDEEFKAIDKEVWEQAYYAARELQKHAVRYYTLSEEEKRREQPPYKERRSSRSLIPLYYASLAKKLKLSDFDIYRALVAWSCWRPELGFSTDLERPQILKDITEYRMKILGIPEYFRATYKKVWRT